MMSAARELNRAHRSTTSHTQSARPQTKGSTTMGASRDLTSRAAASGSTALLERAPERTPRRGERTPQQAAPSGLKPRIAPHVPRGPRRLGSKQVVSVRGRRVTTTDAKRKFSTMSIMALPLLILGIFGAMLLSALSTDQTFTIQQLQGQERTLNNEIETLNRNVEDSRAAAEVAAKADGSGMVVPVQPGIINVEADGVARETREADPEKNLRFVDVNEETIRTDHATSDRNATRDIADNLSALPQNALPRNGASAPARPAPPAPADAAQNAEHPADEAPAAPAGQSAVLPAIPGGL